MKDEFVKILFSNRRHYGFTLMELMIVVTILGILYTVVFPLGGGLVQRSREAALKKNLYVLRESIDKFFADNKRYPKDLDELSTYRYIRAVPRDPFTGSKETWKLIPSDHEKGGIDDVRSGSDATGRDGTPVSSW